MKTVTNNQLCSCRGRCGNNNPHKYSAPKPIFIRFRNFASSTGRSPKRTHQQVHKINIFLIRRPVASFFVDVSILLLLPALKELNVS
uniref:Uncharacterized protein n=1 Tax=Glossina morsitans morsitans TaxID=37546 RepID=A0A1A9YUC5_GLOMM